MAAPTVVEDYVLTAMRLAEYVEWEGGTIGASVPGCGGVLGFGADVHQCSLDGVDLNRQRLAALATYSALPAEPEGEIYEDEESFLAALAEHDKLRAHSTDARKSRANRSAAK